MLTLAIPDTHAIPQFDYQWFCTRKTLLLNVKRLKSVMMFGFGVAVHGSINHSPKEDAEITVNPWLFLALLDG